MSITLTLHFDDGETRRIAGRADRTVYQSAAAAGIGILTECREGACATCKVRCLEGDYDIGDASPEALTAEEEGDGMALACQMMPLTDCALSFPYPFALTLGTGPVTTQGRIIALEHIAEDTLRLELAPDRPLPFLPGQYARIGLPGAGPGTARAFSFSSRNRAEFIIRVLAGGLMSTFLAERAEPGMRVPLSGPYGNFVLRPSARPVVMVAGGTGLGPLLAMLEALDGSRPAHVFFGANRRAQLFGLDRLAALGAVVRTASLEEDGLNATDLIGIPDPDVDAYLCGPPAMIDAAGTILLGAGVGDAHIFAERFLPS